MQGGTISSNTASSNGGGVYVRNNSTFNLSGAPTITGNAPNGTISNGNLSGGTTNNVYLTSGKIITINAALESGASVGVTMANPGTFTTGWKTNMNSTSPSSYFSSDSSDYTVVRSGDEAALQHKNHGNFTYFASGKTITATCGASGLCSLTDKKVSMSISAPQKTTYGDNKSAVAGLVNVDTFNTATGDSISTANFLYFSATKNGTSYTRGTLLPATPTDAGDYMAVLTVGSGSHSATASVGYTIAKAANATTISESNVTVTKTDTTITVTAPVNSNTVQYQYQLDSGAWQGSPSFTGLAPGTSHTVSVKAKGDNNHNDSASVSKSVTTDLTVSLSGTLNDGQTLTAAVTGKDDASFTYAWYRGGTAGFEPSTIPRPRSPRTN